jgi:quaternary ammonium compound-resistance protein SugE
VELLFIILFGIVAGIGVHYALPWRGTHGVALIPAVGGIVAAVVWVGLTWLGWAWDGGWIWAVTLVTALVVAAIVDVALVRSRKVSDQKRLVALGG